LSTGRICDSTVAESSFAQNAPAEAGSYLRLIDFVYHSTVGLRATGRICGSTVAESSFAQNAPAGARCLVSD